MANSALIDFNDFGCAKQSGCISNNQSNWAPSYAKGIYPNTTMPSPQSANPIRPKRAINLDDNDDAWLLQQKGEKTTDGAHAQDDFEVEISSFISDFEHKSIKNPSNFSSFNYKQTSGFKNVRLSKQDMSYVQSVVASKSSPTKETRALVAVAQSSSEKETKPPPSFEIFSLKTLVILLLELLIIVFIVFKFSRG